MWLSSCLIWKKIQTQRLRWPPWWTSRVNPYYMGWRVTVIQHHKGNTGKSHMVLHTGWSWWDTLYQHYNFIWCRCKGSLTLGWWCSWCCQHGSQRPWRSPHPIMTQKQHDRKRLPINTRPDMIASHGQASLLIRQYHNLDCHGEYKSLLIGSGICYALQLKVNRGNLGWAP